MKSRKINVCVKCGSDDIAISNCGYSSFNFGSGRCNKCGNKTIANNGSWGDNDWIIDEWNYKNPTKEQEINTLELKMQKIQKQIENAKQREW